ncbi:MAG TPA: glycosyltransferase [Acidimicrobiales bacterium]|nr:glycosyltransferase [Acidimicrobiales bacterium]
MDGAGRLVGVRRAAPGLVVTAPRVLHVAQSADYGLARFLGDLVRDQQARGWPVAFAGPRLDVDVEWHRWDAARQPGPSVPREVRALARIVREVRPDVVHLHSSKAGLAGRLLLRGTRPTLFQPHAWSFLAVSGPTRAAAAAWERAGARWAHRIVCCSEAERREGEEAGIRGRWEVVPNAVDVARFADAGEPEDPRLVVCVGRLSHQKGQDVLLDAWPMVRARVPDARLVLVGDGPDRDVLAARALLVDGVELVGREPAADPWLGRAAVVALPSRYEGFALTVLEAMAAGRSVVAAEVEGMAEALGGEAGALVPPEDPVALADAVVARLLDPELAASEGRAGRERAARSHDLRGWGDRMAELTLDLLTPA